MATTMASRPVRHRRVGRPRDREQLGGQLRSSLMPKPVFDQPTDEVAS